jgi:hypothetical protein
MSRDLETLNAINDLLNEGDKPEETISRPGFKNFAEVPLPLIWPMGHGRAVALNTGRVVGMKLAHLGRNSSEILLKICELEKLERLVIYDAAPAAIPSKISALKNLKALWFGGRLKSLPEELLTLGLPIIAGDTPRAILSPAARDLLVELETGGDDPTSPKETVLINQGRLTPEIAAELSVTTGIFIEPRELEDPPLEIVRRGEDAIKLYFRERHLGDLPLNELKVILVGNGGSGKTSLVKRIVEEQFDPEEPQTHGISIRQWIINAAGRDVTLNFWDFGGQEIMHATHQFFLSKRSVYILLLDGRKDEDPEYWLQHIESFGSDSPIFLVLNRIDEHPAFDVNRRFLKTKYKGIVDFFRVSCATSVGIRELTFSLGKELQNVPMLQTRWPQSWFNVKRELDSLDTPFLTLGQYKLLCERQHIVDATNQDVLVDFLHDLGVVLHFKDISLLDTHVLDPRWVTEGVYRIINSESLAKRNGLLPLNQVNKILSSSKNGAVFPAEKHVYIIDLMLKFELCYRVGDKAILVPDLLDIQEPPLDFDLNDSLQFIFEFGYLPKSIMPRFIVRMHGDIKRDLRWRTGVLLEDKGLRTTALVRTDEKAKRIFVAVHGQHKRDYFSVIRKVLTEIITSFEKLPVTEFVPLPDAKEVLVDYRELLGHEDAAKEEIFVGRVGRGYRVRDLLSGIEKPASGDARESQVIVNVQGNYYASSNITTQTTQIGVERAKETNMSYLSQTWEKIIVYLSVAAFLVLIGYLLVRNERINDPNLVVALRIILSLITSVFGATVPGMLKVDFSRKGLTIRAMGALALFVITFIATPKVLQ